MTSAIWTPENPPSTGLHPAFSSSMPRELYFTTLDFLIKAIEAKEAEIEASKGSARRERLEAQMTNLQKRLHTEFCYLSDFADGGNQAL